MKSVPPRGSGWVLDKESRLIEIECNVPIRYRVMVLTTKEPLVVFGQALNLHH